MVSNVPPTSPLSRIAGSSGVPCGWVDLHNHLLPGLDDGAKDWDEAVALCRELVRQGVTHAAATPHLFGPYATPGRLERIHRLASELAERLAAEKIELVLYAGADTRIDPDIQRVLSKPHSPVLGGVDYLLVEPPHDVWIAPDRVCEMTAAAGVTAVLTHPERHRYVQRGGVGVLQAWVDRGAVIQLTAGSLVGDFGPKAKAIAWAVLESPVHCIVASDAHDVYRRPPRMGAAADEICHRLGPVVADRVCRDAPYAMIAAATPVRSVATSECADSSPRHAKAVSS